MSKIATKPQAGAGIIDDGQASLYLQNFFDDIEIQFNKGQVDLTTYTKTTLPPVLTTPGLIFVSDAAGGPVAAYSDGTNWRKVSNGDIITP